MLRTELEPLATLDRLIAGAYPEAEAEDLRAVRASVQSLMLRIEGLEALISEEHIERLAKDIAVACADCRQEIVETRHRAMVRLGERLRKPLEDDLKAIEASHDG